MAKEKVLLDDVFGVSNPKPLSYVERLGIDNNFKKAMNGNNAVIVYGASKQGKTALVSRYVDYKKNVVVRLTPETSLSDIYQSILRQNDVQVQISESTSEGKEGTVKIGTKWTALIPFIGSGEVNGDMSSKRSESSSVASQFIPFNLGLPQDIGEILEKLASRKIVILENFHYLSDEKQLSFAFDLRTFVEIGVKFVILGVWREKNRMLQYNGDLIDRVTEIPVEPWSEPFFFMVARKGEPHLNIEFDSTLLKECVGAAFGSIGVFQELLKGVCLAAHIDEPVGNKKKIDSLDFLDTSIKDRVVAYEIRHKQSLVSIAAGQKNVSGNPESGLFLPYYFVKLLLDKGYSGLEKGISRTDLHDGIKSLHHRPNDVRPSDMSNLLYNLSELQAKKGISPPIFAFDRHTNMLQIVDSTFYFFIKNANLFKVKESIETPFSNGTILVS